jgi:hypothetical protein
MHVLLHTDAEGTNLVHAVEAALPTGDASLVLLHLRLLRSPDGPAVIDMLGAKGRTCLIAETLLRYHHPDGSSDTCALLGVTTASLAGSGPVILGDIAPEYWLQIWPSDRPLPTPDTPTQLVHVDDLDE